MSSVGDLVAAANEWRRATDYRRALAVAREAVERLGPDDDPAVAVHALITLSQLEEDCGHLTASESAARSAVMRAGADVRLRATALTRAAAACGVSARPADAAGMAREACDLAAASFGRGTDQHTDALVAAGLAHLDSGDLVAAAVAIDAALASSAEGPARTRARLARANVLRFEGRYDDALALLRATHPIVDDTFGARSLEAASLLNDVGIVCKFSGRFEQGHAAYHEALAILEAVVGTDHPDTASAYHNLGGLEHARRDHQAAEPWARRSVEVRMAVLGPDHPAVAADQVALAGVLIDIGKLDEAEPLLNEALMTYERAYGPVHYEIGVICGTLGSIAQRRDLLDDARTCHERALAVKETVLGPGHPELAITLNNLGVVARRQGRNDEAAARYALAIEILEATTEPDHPTLAAVRRNLDKVLAPPS